VTEVNKLARDGGPRDASKVLAAMQRFDALAPLWVQPDDGFHVWERWHRILLRKVGTHGVWRIAWFNSDGFTMREGIVTPEFLVSQGFRSVWVYCDELSAMLDIFQPVSRGEPPKEPHEPSQPQPG